jgi:hypothetical protein
MKIYCSLSVLALVSTQEILKSDSEIEDLVDFDYDFYEKRSSNKVADKDLKA